MFTASSLYATRKIAPPEAVPALFENVSPHIVHETIAPSYDMAPPSPPLPGLPPVPVALLPTNVLFTTVTFSSCVPIAPPFDPTFPVKVLPCTISVPIPCPLMAPPETSSPVVAHWLFVKVQSMTVSEPPSSKMAAPPSVVAVVLSTSVV